MCFQLCYWFDAGVPRPPCLFELHPVLKMVMPQPHHIAVSYTQLPKVHAQYGRFLVESCGRPAYPAGCDFWWLTAPAWERRLAAASGARLAPHLAPCQSPWGGGTTECEAQGGGWRSEPAGKEGVVRAGPAAAAQVGWLAREGKGTHPASRLLHPNGSPLVLHQHRSQAL